MQDLGIWKTFVEMYVMSRFIIIIFKFRIGFNLWFTFEYNKLRITKEIDFPSQTYTS